MTISFCIWSWLDSRLFGRKVFVFVLVFVFLKSNGMVNTLGGTAGYLVGK